VWLAGVLQIVPVLGVLGILGGLYALYLLYLGLPKLMKCPPETALGYTGAVIVTAIVIGAASGALMAGMYPVSGM
jgi:multisubunit Na+/H+ antiporter MnhC subunit